MIVVINFILASNIYNKKQQFENKINHIQT